jgi:hypothetical protein
LLDTEVQKIIQEADLPDPLTTLDDG